MRRDFLVWLGCGGLFLAGAIWGQLIPGSNFFKVSDIHDLSEIIGAFATTLAVALAFIGLNAWKKQAVATADHDLARRSAVMIQRSKYSLPSSVDMAYYVSMMVNHRVEPTSSITEQIKQEMRSLDELNAELRALEFEVRAVWGESYGVLFGLTFNLIASCLSIFRLYDQWSKLNDLHPDKPHLESVMKQMDQSMRQFQNFDNPDERFIQFSRIFVSLEEHVKNKLIR